MSEPVINSLPTEVRDAATGLWQRNNQRLDDILNALRTDLLGRNPADDAISWLTNIEFMKSQIDERFAKDLLLIALYRLARKEGD